MIIKIVIGLIVWLVVPLLLKSIIKSSNVSKAVDLLCKIIGVAIIVFIIIIKHKTNINRLVHNEEKQFDLTSHNTK